MTDPRTTIKSPPWLKDMNEKLMAEHRETMSVLMIVGRRSGEPRRTPLSVYEHAGQRYVVGGFPAADWIRNARAAGTGVLSVGDRSEDVRIVEVPAADAELVLRAWPSFVPQGVEMMRDAGVVTDTTPDALAEVVGICPVFRLDAIA
jgi:deazaflavin-dependent oxidoreductase (nitroreductase family)